MEEISFKVQGSEAEPYLVTFKRNGRLFNCTCTCKAGQIGQVCKHRLRIMEGSLEDIVSENGKEVKIVVSWLPGTDVEIALAEVNAAEKRLEKTKLELAVLKKKLAKFFLN